MTATAYPLVWPEGWPRTVDAKRGASRFKTGYDSAVIKLRNEVTMLGGRNLVVSTNLPVRNDGSPYADAARRKITDPGVAVYFTLKGKATSMARDQYWTVHENIMSLAHTVEHMRGLERHGGSYMMDRAFSGFMALPAPEQMKPKHPWREVFGFATGITISREMVETMFRIIAKSKHPDHGGSAEAFAELTQAKADAIAEIGGEA